MKKLLLKGLICISLVISISSCKKDSNVIEGLPTVITSVNCEVHPTSTLVNGECTNQGDSEVSAKGMVWGTSSEPDLNNKLSYSNHGTGIGTFKSSITNLASGTKYYYRAYATNTQGTAYGEVLTFITPN